MTARPSLHVEALEDRVVPVTWPVGPPPSGGPAELLGTYAQFQRVKLHKQAIEDINFQYQQAYPGQPAPLDPNGTYFVSHLHEGLDIRAAANSKVYAATTGIVEDAYINPDDAYNSFIVMRDVKTLNGEPLRKPNGDWDVGPRGWNYKHVVGNAVIGTTDKIRPGVLIREGEEIGTVAPFPAAQFESTQGTASYGDHVHLDRGEWNRDPKGDKLRDPTMIGRPEYKYFKKLRDNPATPGAQRSPLINLVRALGWQYVTNINPLTEFMPGVVVNPGKGVAGITVVDEIKPTVTKIDFRVNEGEDGKEGLRRISWIEPATTSQVLDQEHKNGVYFTGTKTIGQKTYQHLGVYAKGERAKGKNPPPGSPMLAKIDIVVGAYDRFDTAAQKAIDDDPVRGPILRKLNPAGFRFQITGIETITQATDSGVMRSFDFRAAQGRENVPDPQGNPQSAPLGIGRFFNISTTRTINENDTNHNTEMIAGDKGFFYVLTNNSNIALPADKQPGPGDGVELPGINQQRWVTNAERGKPLDWINKAPNNAGSAYPDGLYKVEVVAEDLRQEGSKSVEVLITNWQRTVEMNGVKNTFQKNDVVKVTGGEQYLANQKVDVYAVLRPQGGQSPADNASLAGALKITATANAAGKLGEAQFGVLASGTYDIVADYNGDGIYTHTLDAMTNIVVQGPPQGQAPPPTTITLTSSANPAHYGEPLTLWARATYPSGGGPSSGTVRFFDGPIYLGTEAVGMGLRDVKLTPGTHDLRAEFTYWYPGYYTGTLTQTVLPNTTDITLTSDRSTTNYYEPITFTAVVTAPYLPSFAGGGTAKPTGFVRLLADGVEFACGQIDANGLVTIIQNPLERGTRVVTAVYTGDDFFSASTSNSVTQVVRNNLPIAVADAVITTAGSGVRVVALRNDYDPDGDELDITAVSTPAHGTAAFSDDGSVSYTPSPGYTGNDSFTYTVTDEYGGTATATVSVRVLPQWGGNRVFTDANANGVQDAGDVGIPFVLVRVLNSVGVEVAAVLTDDNGYYDLPTNLAAGNYRLVFDLPDILPVAPFSKQDYGGNDARDSDVDATGTSGWIAFAPSTGWPDIDAGVVIDPSKIDVAHLYG